MEVSNEIIEKFLQGNDPEQYIVGVESYYDKNYVDLIINEPDKPKYIKQSKFKPFLWLKEEVLIRLFDGKTQKRLDFQKSYGVTIKKLRTYNAEGYSPERMLNGYTYIATCDKSYNSLVHFFKEGGVDVFNKENSKLFVTFNPTEQFLIQTGKRLFKGIEDYDDLHRFQFDLETEGLFASKHAIFQIGVRDNRGVEGILETSGETGTDRRNSERENIIKFFQIIDAIQPDIIAGYNSENFDWPFLFERAERLGMDVSELAITLNRISKIKRKPSTLKLGGETESYNQTHMFGYNITDISHAVRRAMAINSEIKSWGLKYITQYSGIAKPNRVYVPGDKINSIWADKDNKYAFNDTNGDWYKITDKRPLEENYVIKTGAYIVQRYLSDDLWETEQVDNIYNQATFLISKILPTTFMRASTMGTAGQWKLIMSAWSYENGLAIPEGQPKRDFTGGLSRLFEVGFAKDVYKFDFAALYPKTQITHGIFPDLDITGVMKGMLTYVVDSRDKFKFLTGSEKKLAKKLENELKEKSKDLNTEEINKLKSEIEKHKSLATLYDKKQLPLKILANSWFGSYGAPYIFNWGDVDSAEETTCRGRQYLRLMVKHFVEKYNFKVLIIDTDGANLSAPENLNEVKYIAKGTHWKTEGLGGKELNGAEAIIAEFNEKYMIGRMGLDIDDYCETTINFARKNYANLIGDKIKLVGNSIKSKKMPVYIEEFINEGIKLLLNGDGEKFINLYYEYVDKIYNYQIPLVKIASKAKVKSTISDYKKKITQKNKAGNPMPRQAHMELALQHNLDINLGDIIYYVNTGVSKSTGDLKTVDKNKMTKKEKDAYFIEHGVMPTPNKVVELNCKLINPETVEKDFESIKELEILKKSLDVVNDDEKPDILLRIDEIENELYTDEYNVARYLDAFNKKVKPLLVCFDYGVRDNILLTIEKVKDKVTKKTTERLKERKFFTTNECKLVSGKPFGEKENEQDTYEDLMIMEDKEIKFWDKVGKIPNNMDEKTWEITRLDYHQRKLVEKEEGIRKETELLDTIIQRLEYNELKDLAENSIIPLNILNLFDFELNENDEIILKSIKWGEIICNYNDLFKYKNIAKERYDFYNLKLEDFKGDKYQEWLDYQLEQKFLNGETVESSIEIIFNDNFDLSKIDRTNFSESKLKLINKTNNENEDGDETHFILDENGNYIIVDEILKLDDGYDDTQSEIPEGYENLIINEEINENVRKIEDEWGF